MLLRRPPHGVSPLSCFRRLLAKFSDGSVVSGAPPSLLRVPPSFCKVNRARTPSPPPLRFHPPFLPPPAIVHFARAKNRLSRPFLYFQRSQTTSRSPWFDERHDDRPRDDRIQFRSAGRNRIGRSVGSKIMLPAWPLYLRSTPHHVGPRFVTLHARDPVHLPPDKGYPMIR